MALGTGDVLLFRDSPCEHRVTGLGPLAEIQSAAAGGAAARVEARAAERREHRGEISVPNPHC